MSIPSAPSFSGNFRPDLAEGMKSYDIEAIERGYIGTQIAPVVEVPETQGNIGKYPLDDLLRIHDTERAMGAAYAEGTLKLEDLDYKTQDQGFSLPIDDRFIKANRNRYAQLQQHIAETARQVVMGKFEKRTLLAATDASVLTGDLTDAVTTAWSNRSSAKPIDDLSAFRQASALNGGVMPNSLALDLAGFENMINNSQILDRISASGAGDKIKPTDVNIAMLAQAINVQNIFVSQRIVNTAGVDGVKDLSYLWPAGKALLFYRGPNSSNPFELNYMNTLHWGEDSSTMGGVIEEEVDWKTRSTHIRSRMDTDELVKYPELGFLITGLI